MGRMGRIWGGIRRALKRRLRDSAPPRCPLWVCGARELWVLLRECVWNRMGRIGRIGRIRRGIRRALKRRLRVSAPPRCPVWVCGGRELGAAEDCCS